MGRFFRKDDLAKENYGSLQVVIFIYENLA